MILVLVRVDRVDSSSDLCVREGGRKEDAYDWCVCEREREGREERAMTGIFTIPIATP
jgi:hypothetical protein